MATLGLSINEIYASIGQVLGTGRTYSALDSTTQADFQRIVRSGRRRFFQAHNWSFLEQHIKVLTAGPFTDGTIAATAGIVTLTGGVWPAGAAYSVLVPTDDTYGDAYEVSSRGSATKLNLNDTNVTLSALTTYNLYQFRYPLPSNFAGWLDPVVIENQPDDKLRETATLPEWTLRGIRHAEKITTGRPELYAVTQIVGETTGVPSYFLDLHPLPDAVYVLTGRMSVNPADALEIDPSDKVFHPSFSETMLAAILSSAELMQGETGVWSQKFAELLPQAIEKDRRMRGTRRIRPRDDQSRLPPDYQYRIAPITWE